MSKKIGIREYYEILREIKGLSERLEDTRKRKKYYKALLEGRNIDLNTDLGCQKYSDEILGQGGKPSSKVEQEIERKYSQYEEYYVHAIKEENYLEDRIYNLELDIKDIEYMLKRLTDDEIKVLELKYKHRKPIKRIVIELFGGARTTAYRCIKDIEAKIMIV